TAISDRFEFRTVVVFFADRDHEATNFARAKFDVLDDLTGSDILVVSLAEPRGGYWQYLKERAEREHRDEGSIRKTIAGSVSRVKEKRDLVQLTFNYEPQPQPPSREQLGQQLDRMGLAAIGTPFLLLFALPPRGRSIWSARPYAVVKLDDQHMRYPADQTIMEVIVGAIRAAAADV